MNIAESPGQRLFIRTLFANKVLRFDGTTFQDFFVTIMRKRYPSFRTIKPHGNKGDQGNDGFIPEEGIYFQVYSPENPNSKITTAILKAKEDFEKVLSSWDDKFPIKSYRFVFNDKFKGTYPDVEKALAEIKDQNPIEDSRPHYAQHIEADFLELCGDDQMEVLGTIIPDPETLDEIEFAVITDVLQHVVENRAPVSASSLLSVPDFSEKIKFNNLSHISGALLQAGSYQNGVIEDFFTQIPAFNRRDVRDRLRAIYEEQLETLREADLPERLSRGDLVFCSLLEQIVPSANKASQEVAISLIAYFFEQCDVFEDPKT